jgi:hypothetical protein
MSELTAKQVDAFLVLEQAIASERNNGRDKPRETL